jgi:hypothetical protein
MLSFSKGSCKFSTLGRGEILKIALNSIYFILCFLLSTASWAESLDSLHGLVQNRMKLKESAHWYSDPYWIGGIKSQNNLGKASQWGQTIISKEELFIGARTPKGWGIYVLGATTIRSSPPASNPADGSVRPTSLKRSPGSNKPTTSDAEGIPTPASSNGYGDFSGNKAGIKDPNIAILHPLFDDGKTSISGMIKESFPTTDFSLSQHTWVQGYYSILGVRISDNVHFSNIIMLHYFSRDSYNPPFDTNFSSGVMTSIQRKLNKWCRVGFGQRFQFDIHQQGPAGSSEELFTSADFSLAPTVSIGPRLHFPIASQNAVISEFPSTPAIANIQAELYFQATL